MVICTAFKVWSLTINHLVQVSQQAVKIRVYNTVNNQKRLLCLNNHYYKLVLFLPQYELRLAASDNLKENYTTVVIHVKDVNDNPPVFERPTYRTQITEEDDRNLPKSVLRASVSHGRYPSVFVFVVVAGFNLQNHTQEQAPSFGV